jgi:hypothetical protein
MRIRTFIITLCTLAACGGGGSKAEDAAPMADAFFSKCGHPGDTGNELGIGKFCASQGDCGTTTDAPLCSSLGDQDTHFCTKTCPMGSTDQCGADATCACNGSNQCGCTPNTCL